jgi:hypothetical protein
MGVTVTFDLTPAQVQEALRFEGTGLFAGWKRSLMDKGAAQLAPRLAGPTTVEASEAGLRITTAGGVQELAWAEIGSVNERRHVWGRAAPAARGLHHSGFGGRPCRAWSPRRPVADLGWGEVQGPRGGYGRLLRRGELRRGASLTPRQETLPRGGGGREKPVGTASRRR